MTISATYSHAYFSTLFPCRRPTPCVAPSRVSNPGKRIVHASSKNSCAIHGFQLHGPNLFFMYPFLFSFPHWKKSTWWKSGSQWTWQPWSAICWKEIDTALLMILSRTLLLYLATQLSSIRTDATLATLCLVLITTHRFIYWSILAGCLWNCYQTILLR